MSDDLTRSEASGDQNAEKDGSPAHSEQSDAATSEGADENSDSPVYSSSSDPYGQPAGTPEPEPPVDTPAASQGVLQPVVKAVEEVPAAAAPPSRPPSGADTDEEEEGGEEEEGMLRMSFMEHLEELRSRLISALLGLVVAFFLSLFFTNELWRIVSAPAVDALKHLGIDPPALVAITPMEQFNIIWLKMPVLVAIFLGSPWILYQVWSFISPGLYRREKRWAAPFILCTAGLFISGGVFAYYVAFRYGLEFLLGIGRNANVRPMVSINEYFDLFVNVTLGVGLVFEMPVIIFFLTVLRLASPRFLLRNSRYAILAITVLAAVVTPTPDIFNMMIFAVPMVMLFFVGVFASYLLVIKREGKKFPWALTIGILLAIILLAGGGTTFFLLRNGFHLTNRWPFFVK